MFCNSAITTLPEGFNLLPNINTVGDHFAANMFYNCTSLRPPSNYDTFIYIPKSGSNDDTFCYLMFYGITRNITSTPADAVAYDGTPDPGSIIVFNR